VARKLQKDISVELLKYTMAKIARKTIINNKCINLVESGLLGAKGMNKEATLSRLLNSGKCGVVKIAAKPVTRNLITETMREGGKTGLVGGMLRRVALPAALVGGGYLAYKTGKGLLRMAQRAAHNPPPYSHGLQQYQYGYGPEGQANF
jgi:hypothetical protein